MEISCAAASAEHVRTEKPVTVPLFIFFLNRHHVPDSSHCGPLHLGLDGQDGKYGLLGASVRAHVRRSLWRRSNQGVKETLNKITFFLEIFFAEAMDLFCVKCGVQAKAGAKFCTKCGGATA